jgi:hypothetical protein
MWEVPLYILGNLAGANAYSMDPEAASPVS